MRGRLFCVYARSVGGLSYFEPRDPLSVPACGPLLPARALSIFFTTLRSFFGFGDELCGLVGGRLSERREVVRIDLLEGKPGPHPLKGWVALIAAEVGAVTAQAYDSRSVRFYKPLPGAIFIYEDLGFGHVPAFKNTAAYCEKRLP